MIINIDKNFTPFGKEDIGVTVSSFPSGCEMYVKVNDGNPLPDENSLITGRIKTSNDIFVILLCIDAVIRLGISRNNISLFIPYLPYARQDRVVNKGESFSLKVLTNILYSLNLKEIIIYDAHSTSPNILLDNIKNINNHKFIQKVFTETIPFDTDTSQIIVCPDAGARKKMQHLLPVLKNINVVYADKVRDSAGKIIKTTIDVEEVRDFCIIVDDICDGGGTFIPIAKALKKAGAKRVILAVSHGIFSKGLDVLNDIDYFYTTDSFDNGIKDKKLTIIKLEDGLLY
jgi:ribose-phosphate pyrophosphokinase